jgi:hypothetical protein
VLDLLKRRLVRPPEEVNPPLDLASPVLHEGTRAQIA